MDMKCVKMFTLLYSIKSAAIMILVYFSCVAMITLCFRLTIIYGSPLCLHTCTFFVDFVENKLY